MEELVTGFIHIERSTPVLWSFSVAINIRTGDECSSISMHAEANTFLQQEKYATTCSTFVSMPCTFSLASSVKNFTTNEANSG
jgi:hypothetical protein